MYKCKPERSVLQARLIGVPGFVLSFAALIFGGSVPEYGSFVTLAGFVLLCVTLMLVLRYVMSEYEYSVDGESFTVTRVMGKKRTDMCCISLSTAIELYKKQDYAALPKAEKAITKYSLNQNIKADSYVFLCEFNGRRTMVEFEPNEAFAGIMREQIAAAKKNADGENPEG